MGTGSDAGDLPACVRRAAVITPEGPPLSLVATVAPLPRTSRAGRAALLFGLVLALCAGLMSGVARADDTGGFTPVDFSQAPVPTTSGTLSISGGLTFTGSLNVDGLFPSTPQDVRDGELVLTTYDTAGRPARGEAHLFSRNSGIAPMTDAQYAGMVALEDEAVRTVMATHGITDTPYNHGRRSPRTPRCAASTSSRP